MQFISKPVKIEAFVFTENINPLKYPTWFLKYYRVDSEKGKLINTVKTKNGWVKINEGDFAIFGGDEVYPCPPDVFNKKYEAVK